MSDVREGTGPEVFALVREDLAVRASVGMETYGVRLRCFNGRDALWDLYEELLDACVYIRQRIEEDRLLGSPDGRQRSAPAGAGLDD